ncbi:MAG: hypothetical protein LBH27_02990 [Endomicrobium sp.]|jgi:hypothetical protein|nr:hypothetical protein [Endomicrobium sp.]
MILSEIKLQEMISMSNLGRYEIVKLALRKIEIMKQNCEHKKLTQFEFINMALSNVINESKINKF